MLTSPLLSLFDIIEAFTAPEHHNIIEIPVRWRRRNNFQPTAGAPLDIRIITRRLCTEIPIIRLIVLPVWLYINLPLANYRWFSIIRISPSSPPSWSEPYAASERNPSASSVPVCLSGQSTRQDQNRCKESKTNTLPHYRSSLDLIKNRL